MIFQLGKLKTDIIQTAIIIIIYNKLFINMKII